MNKEELENILTEAQSAAIARSTDLYKKHGDSVMCGFAWVYIDKYDNKPIKGNTKIGKMLKGAEIHQDYTRAFQVWGGTWYGGQSIDIKEAGAQAYAEVLRKYGFEVRTGSRYD